MSVYLERSFDGTAVTYNINGDVRLYIHRKWHLNNTGMLFHHFWMQLFITPFVLF